MKMKLTIMAFFLTVISCNHKVKVSDSISECIQTNTKSIIDVDNSTVFDLFESIELDLMSNKLLHSNSKFGYISLIDDLSNKNSIDLITPIMFSNFNKFSTYPDFVMNVGSSYYGCLKQNKDYLNNDYKMLLNVFDELLLNENDFYYLYKI